MLVNLKSLAAVLATAAGLLAGPAFAATCNSGDFAGWLADAKREAASQGVGPRGVAALDGIAPSAAVLKADRSQGVFRQTFEQFAPRMINPRLPGGLNRLRAQAGLFQRIETGFGVSAPILVAIWGLETSYGAVNGNFPTIQALATLAYDCRRAEKFRAELFDALKIVDRGDMAPAAMRGAWAGEIGQTQFMPSSYLKFAVDFDGDGRRDLVRSVPDALASTANFLKGYGWSRGAGWEPGQPNFAAIREWNKSDVYSRTIARFATQLAGADR